MEGVDVCESGPDLSSIWTYLAPSFVDSQGFVILLVLIVESGELAIGWLEVWVLFAGCLVVLNSFLGSIGMEVCLCE